MSDLFRILGNEPFRRYPVKASKQQPRDDHRVCHDCLGGTCCSSEDPIYVTAFDVLRLSAYFHLPPAEFLLKFTQDRFDREDSDLKRRAYIDDPDSSVITYLRRRANYATSPCIFLKYVEEEDGTPRRVCSVHPARPLSCREYYHDTCKTRWTGEIAAIEAHCLEAVRDGRIDLATAEAKAALPAGDTPSYLERAFWTHARRALRREECNTDGANAYDIAQWQDPIDEKLNRMLSQKYLRFEEKYGPEPMGDQLAPYDAGLSFLDSAERARILNLVERRPRTDLFAGGDFPGYVVSRFHLPALAPSFKFREMGEREIAGFQPHDAARLRAANRMARFAGYVGTIGKVLEVEEPGQMEFEIAMVLAPLRLSEDPVLSRHGGVRKAEQWALSRLAKVLPPAAWAKVSAKLRRARPIRFVPSEPEDQAEHLRQLLHAAAAGMRINRSKKD